MKKLSILLLLAITSAAFAQEIPPPPAGMSTVYFFRTSSLGAAINFSYFDSTRLIGRFNGPKYIRYDCRPGAHLFWARSENKDFIEADLQPDKIYFILAVPQMGAFKAAVQIEAVDPGDIKTLEKIAKLMAKKPGETFTPEKLASDEKDLKDAVANGMERYQELKAKNTAIPKLDKPIK